MNKGIIAAVSGGVIAVCAGIGFILWYGNQPMKEYYPNGAIKSITQRKMFQHTGKCQMFAQDGTLIEEFEQIKGVKNGKAKIYFKDGSAEFGYVNGTINSPLKINSEEYAKYLENVDINIANSMLKLDSGEIFGAEGKITCKEDEFVANMQSFLNLQNYDNFKKFFGCLSINTASIKADEGKCEYKGAYQYPQFKADTSISCEEANAEFLKGYTQGFDAVSDMSSNFVDIEGVEFNAGDIGNLESFKFNTDFDIKTKKISFDLSTVSDKAKMEQKASFGGIEKMIESSVEFAFSPQQEGDVKKLLLSALQNISWSDLSTTINDHKRFDIKGDFNVMNGFSDPYVMSYYGNNEVTTQWKIDGKGTRITSKYPNTNKPMLSLGLNVNDGFKKAYKNLVKDGLNIAMNGSSAFNPKTMEKIQNEAIDLVKGISSVSGILMNSEGKKTISGVMALQKNINIEKFMTDPIQSMNFKVMTYQNDKPEKVYVGNFRQGFALNGRKLSNDELQMEMQGITELLKNNVDGIISELEKVYGNIDDTDTTWIDSDVDPFLFGFYKGYTSAQKQDVTEQYEQPIEIADEVVESDEYVEPEPVIENPELEPAVENPEPVAENPEPVAENQ